MTKFTDLELAIQGPELVVPLEGRALDTILEPDDKNIWHDNDIITIINKLNSLCKKDKLNEKLEELERFESYKRLPETQMQQSVAEFDRAYNKLKGYAVIFWVSNFLKLLTCNHWGKPWWHHQKDKIRNRKI